MTLRGVDPETCMIVFKNHWAQVTSCRPTSCFPECCVALTHIWRSKVVPEVVSLSVSGGKDPGETRAGPQRDRSAELPVRSPEQQQ